MKSLCAQLIADHSRCDDLFLQVENMVCQLDWVRALSAIQSFGTAFRNHVSLEESTFFPLLRKVAGDDAWPIKMLAVEHAQLEMILRRMEEAVQNRNHADFVLHAESFLILMQHHSIKEEEILYPGLERRDLVLLDRPGMQTLRG